MGTPLTSLATLQTRLTSLDTLIDAAIAAPDFETAGSDGARVRIQRQAQLDALYKRRRETIAAITVAGGTLVAEPSRLGIDEERSTSNGDDI